jgi:predicted ATP-dependent serine protease
MSFNAVGGLQIFEPAADLPVLSHLIILRNRPSADLIAFRRVGLSWRTTKIAGQERLKEVAKHGFKITRIHGNAVKNAVDGMKSSSNIERRH